MNIISTGVRKSYNGLRSVTTLTEIPNHEKDVEIVTCKNNRGEIQSSFQFGKHEQKDGYSTFTYMIYGHNEYGTIVSKKARATEKAIGTQHNEAVHKFITEHLKMNHHE